MNELLKRIAAALAVAVLATGAGVASAQADPTEIQATADTSWSQ